MGHELVVFCSLIPIAPTVGMYVVVYFRRGLDETITHTHTHTLADVVICPLLAIQAAVYLQKNVRLS